MSLRKRGRKIRPDSGKQFRNSSGAVASSGGFAFRSMIAETLHQAFGGTGAAIKTVMSHTGAGERTVKNWFEGKNGPNGENLIQLVRHTDEVLEALLLMAGREDILAGKLLVDARDRLVEMLEIIDELQSGEMAPEHQDARTSKERR